MKTEVCGKTVRFPDKLLDRLDEVLSFANELIEEDPGCEGVKIWENKRGDLAAKVLHRFYGKRA